MHEMSLAESVLQTLEDAARNQHFRRVLGVRLEIGALSGVEPDAMRFCFDAVVRDSLAEGAVLDIIVVPGTAKCMACSRTVPMQEVFGECPACGSVQLQVTGGTEMRIKDLDVE